jgi:hypothetical protein
MSLFPIRETSEHEASSHYQDDANEATVHFLMDDSADDEEAAWDDEDRRAIVESEVVTDTDTTSRPKCRLDFIIVGLLVLIVTLAVGVSLNKDQLQRIWWTRSASVDGNIILEHFIRYDLPSYSVRAIHDNASSPQHRALDWLGEDPKLHTYPAWKRQQRFALATFYYSLGGEHWNIIDNNDNGNRRQLEANYYGKDNSKLWMSYNVDECEWYSSDDTAVNTNPVCTENGEYTSLHLDDLNLAGILPDELSLLSGLESIRLVSDQENIMGKLPSRLGLLKSLRTLILHGLGLGGEIPDGFARCTGLHQVDLSRNYLSGPLPIPVLSAWTNIMDLNLGSNLFTGRITDVSEIVFKRWSQSLVSLDLSDNSLSGSIGHAIGNHLTSLESLKLMDNDLEGEIPDNLKLLSHLQELTLYKNHLTGKIPTHLAELGKLLTLDIGGNFLSGDIPTRKCCRDQAWIDCILCEDS